ncbi:hypothetical protein JCM6882_005955 [Rhodosporidiobolus microsporus]
MGCLNRCAFVTVAAVAALAALLAPKLRFAGVGRTVAGLNNGECFAVEGLQACEDAKWADQHSGIAYLACSSHDRRLTWEPASLRLNASALPPVSEDYLAVFNLSSRSYSKLELIGLPEEAGGIYTLGLDVLRAPSASNPERLLLIAISHRPPLDRSTAGKVGADSVVEVFETSVGAKEATWVRTVRHELVKTPNAVAVVSEKGFYVSNDHRYKTSAEHWTRPFNELFPTSSSLVYCDISRTEPDCIVATDDVVFPNGIAVSGDKVYHASSLQGKIGIWESQSDHTLVPLSALDLGVSLDNLALAADGSVYVATFPKIFELLKVVASAGKSDATSAVEIWRLSNETSEAQFYGQKHRKELVFADDGKVASGSTTAAPYQDKLLLTGTFAKEVVVCAMPR